MSFNPALIVPEAYMMLLVAALFIQTIGKGEWQPKVERWLPIFSGLGCLVALCSFPYRGTIFAGAYQVDAMSQFFKVVIALGFFFAVVNATKQKTLENEKRTDYFMLMAFSALGLCSSPAQ